MESSRTLLKLQNMWKQAFYMILVVFLVVSIHEKDHRLSIFYDRTSNWLFASAQNHNVKSQNKNEEVIEISIDTEGNPSEETFPGASLFDDPIRKQTKKQPLRKHPATENLMADFDHDGVVEPNEIRQLKQELHKCFDIDESGSIDTKEIERVIANEKDASSAFQRLDRDHDSIISHKELDERWEALGAEMTVNEVADWITYSVQLPKYAEMFRKNSISGYTFPLLMEKDGIRLKEIGIDSELHRRQLAMFLKMKYLNAGKTPDRVVAVACDYGGLESAPDGKVFIHITWVPGEDIAHRFQLQKRNPDDMLWKTVYSGSETEFIDVVDAIKHQVIVYRIASWNSIGRSPHEYIKCKPPTTIQNVEANINPPSTNKRPGNHSKNFSFSESFTSSLYGLIKSYLWWVDEVLALVFLIAFPVRFFLYGDANYILRLLRLLPPNMPRRVVVELDLNKSSLTDASVNVSWEKPEDNGVPLVCYCVRWTRMKTEEVKWVKLFQLPLPTTTCIRHLHHGETYKFVVEATNKHGLISRSSRSTYMVPVPELKGKLIPGKSIKAPRVTRNQCYICHDPLNTKKIPFTAALDKKILHFCRICDQEFCHYHKGHVHHTKALSCPAVDGRCVCEKCSLQTNLK